MAEFDKVVQLVLPDKVGSSVRYDLRQSFSQALDDVEAETKAEMVRILEGSYKDSYKGKLWSTAVQKCFEAPFPEVAMQYLLNRVHQHSRIETLKELLKMKWEAYNEKEAISPMGIISVGQSEGLPRPTDANVRQLQYVKVWDIEKLLEEASDAIFGQMKKRK